MSRDDLPQKGRAGKPHPLVVRISIEDGVFVVQGLDWQIERLLVEAEALGVELRVDSEGLCG